jgi:predicted PurR-regulated permease PerM
MAIELTERQRRWLDALLVLGTVAVGLVVVNLLGAVFYAFGDVILVFFLAWLLAFIISPMVGLLVRSAALPRVVAVVLVYAVLLGLLVVVAVTLANTLAASISDFIGAVPTLRDQLPAILAPWQARLDAVGLGQVNLADQAGAFLANLNAYASQLVGPLQQLAVASLGVLGNLLIVLMLSLYMAIDRDRIMAFLLRLVPPAYAEEATLLETSIAVSFGGFLRGQAVMGLTYGAFAALVSAVLGLGYLPITSAAAGILQTIPFFGPFVSWLPPVLVAVVLKPESMVPAVAAMGIGWFVVMNVLQPRLMEKAVGIHPIVVLGSVLVGSKIAGISGAIFGIPIAAVLSAFFLHAYGKSRDQGTVAVRAARRVAGREGRPVRGPSEPMAADDLAADDLAADGANPATPGGE